MHTRCSNIQIIGWTCDWTQAWSSNMSCPVRYWDRATCNSICTINTINIQALGKVNIWSVYNLHYSFDYLNAVREQKFTCCWETIPNPNSNPLGRQIGLPTLDLGIPVLLPLPSPPSFSPSLHPSLSPGAPPPKPARGSGERCKLPSGIWGEAPADKRFGSYLSQKEQLWYGMV